MEFCDKGTAGLLTAGMSVVELAGRLLCTSEWQLDISK